MLEGFNIEIAQNEGKVGLMIETTYTAPDIFASWLGGLDYVQEGW